MKPHVAQTIEDIELKIGFLQRLADALRNFDSVTSIGAPAVAAAAAAVVETPKPRRGRPRLVKTPESATPPLRKPIGEKINKANRLEPANPLSPRMVNAGRTIAEPFGADDLRKAAGGVAYSSAANSITRWLAKKWLERVGHGQYKRTAQFGQEDVPTDLQKLHAQIRGEVDAANSEKD